MIAKELDPAQPTNKFETAGRHAEEQMAFYLSRAFADSKKIHVFNGLRFVRDKDAAQIDHLVLHKCGIIVIESKSVTTEVRVDEQGAWTRVYKGVEQGMKSPVIQAKMQVEFLGRYLEAHIEEVLNKILGIQQYLGTLPIDVLVAVSDKGVLRRPKGIAPEACKADQIPDRVSNLIDEHRRANGFFNFRLNTGRSLSAEELRRLIAFLLKHHTPYQEARRTNDEATVPTSDRRDPAPPLPTAALKENGAAASARPQTASQAPTVVCAKCGGTTLTLAYKYNFFLRCAGCEAANPLIVHCLTCGAERNNIKRPDTSQDHGALTTKCPQCGHSIPVKAP